MLFTLTFIGTFAALIAGYKFCKSCRATLDAMELRDAIKATRPINEGRRFAGIR